VVGNPDVLRERYEAWKAELPAGQGCRVFELGLGTPRGMAGVGTGAGGVVRIDLDSGDLEARVSGLEGDHELWLIAGHTGSSLRPSPAAPRTCVGRFVSSGFELTLRTELGLATTRDFALDLALVVPSGGDPTSAGVLFGMPSLFQRLLAEEQRIARAAERCQVASEFGLSLALLPPAQGRGVPRGSQDVLQDLVSRGEDLFFNETFAGNGRTCGTCHPAHANFTLSADDIAALPPSDPLFVAEHVPALNASQNGGLRFENPVLMRKFGLILENVDGTEDLRSKFVMRGIPHTLGMSRSLQRQEAAIDPSLERTGWGGDGAPSGPVGTLTTAGRLLDFAVGAVNQHFTKTLNRQIGVDFRLPTTAELVAMEAFQLSLGRTSDPDLAALSFRDPDVDRGRQLFLRGPRVVGAISCNACHSNAGAFDSLGVAPPSNANFNTGIEQFLVNHPDETGEPRPRDGGFGVGLPPQPNGSFGNQTFNTPSIIEAADTAPFFHNNALETLEDTVAFYNTPEFANAFFGIRIPFDATEIEQVAAFLRAINTLDNLDNSAVRYAHKAIAALGTAIRDADDDAVVNRILLLALADLEDCDEVLAEDDLHADARAELRLARESFKQAQSTSKPALERTQKVQEALERIGSARALIVRPVHTRRSSLF
jgi:cytochrome c peroxidase